MNRRKFIKSAVGLLVLSVFPTLVKAEPKPEMLLGYPVKKISLDSWIKANPKLLDNNITIKAKYDIDRWGLLRDNSNVIINGGFTGWIPKSDCREYNK